ncbi:MAG: NAD(P)-dependent alcohol dehydrogenase, partial [Planctomycetales bacterium]
DGLTLAERPDPAPGENEVLIDVHAVSLNYRDLLVASGQYGGVQDPPIIATSDMAGVVSEIGSGVKHLQPGDRVFNAPLRNWPAGQLCRDWSNTFGGGQGLDGVLAEQVVYPAASLVPIPEHLSFSQAATLTVAGLTAWAAIVTHGRTRPGEWVLIHGTGGVAIFAAQIAKLLGGRVIQTTSSATKADRLKQELGVDETLDYRDKQWPDRVRKITGGAGVDVIVELAGGTSLARSVEACGYGARIGVIGVLDGLESSINVFALIMHQVQLRGIYMESALELHRFANAVSTGKLVPVVDREFPFEDALVAYEYLKSQQHFGKVVIRVAG